MAAMTEQELSALLRPEARLRQVEPHIYSVLPDDETGSEYDKYGRIYDLVACNPIYNRLVWGYSTSLFKDMAGEALGSAPGCMLDLGCGSLAFTAKAYLADATRPLVLADQSLEMLRLAKARLVKLNGRVPDHLVFLQADATDLPFAERAFDTLICQNLLHHLPETSGLLAALKLIMAPGGGMHFTTLVRGRRFGDGYLRALASKDKLISRGIADHEAAFARAGLAMRHALHGNLASFRCSA